MRNTIGQDEMTALARAQADKLRVVRRAIKPVIGHEYVDSVPGHEVSQGSQPPWEMSVRPNQHLQPLQISRHFMLYREQSSDFETLKSLITNCAADIALAEDAVILLGAAASNLLNNTLHVTFEDAELRAQKRLWRGPNNVQQAILNSILQARTTLQTYSQYGEYYVIVSPALYEEAYKPLTSATTDAPIYQILPLLAKDGFLYSDALGPEKRGVMFSLARGTISLSVPMDIWVDSSLPNDGEGRPRYKVGEQFLLVIDNANAVVDLL
jgi:uncharacterized linocin/CFP29 family protein